MATLEQAIALAARLHEGQRDKAGEPYILHPLQVMLSVEGEEARIVAILHDVLEDSQHSAQELLEQGFSARIVDAIEALTRRESETYEEFIRRAGANPLARKVKIADLNHNLDLRRLPSLSDEDLARVQRYWQALRYLAALEASAGDGGDSPPGAD